MKAVKFSPILGNNIGDIAISKSIEYLFQTKNIEVTSKDLLFRQPFSYLDNKHKPKNSIRSAVGAYLQLNLPLIFDLLKASIFWMKGEKNKFLSESQGYDFIILGGGNIIMSSMGSEYGRRVSSFLKISKTPIILFSCGVGPFLNYEESICRTVMNKSTYCSVRDDNSLSYFKDIPGFKEQVVRTIDPAFIISKLYPKIIKPLGTIGVNVISNFFSVDEVNYLAKEIINTASFNNLNIRIIVTAYPSDEKTAKLLKSAIDKSKSEHTKVDIVNLDVTLSNLNDAYSGLKFFVGCRMHSLIFSLSYGVPVYAFKWDEKVESMLRAFYANDYCDYFLLKNNYDLKDMSKLPSTELVSSHLSEAIDLVESDLEKAISKIDKNG